MDRGHTRGTQRRAQQRSMIHLDTNFLIASGQSGSREATLLLSWRSNGTPLAMSAIAWTEFLCGPVTNPAIRLAQRLVPEIVPLDRHTAALSAQLFNLAGRRRGTQLDCMIAAAAIRAGARLATCDIRHFERLTSAGLNLV